MSKRKSGWGLPTAIGVGALVALGGWASSAAAKGTGRGGPGGRETPGGGGGGSGGGGSDPWTTGPGGHGRVYGGAPGGGMPDGFDFAGNGLWVSPECELVLEGDAFRPGDDDDMIMAIEPPEFPGYTPGEEVMAVLGVDPTNSIAGYLDWAMNNGFPDAPLPLVEWVATRFVASARPQPAPAAIALAAEVLRQRSPLCLDVPNLEQHWGEGLAMWMEDFIAWVDVYLHEWDFIDFDPSEPELDDGPIIPDAP